MHIIRRSESLKEPSSGVANRLITGLEPHADQCTSLLFRPRVAPVMPGSRAGSGPLL